MTPERIEEIGKLADRARDDVRDLLGEIASLRALLPDEAEATILDVIVTYKMSVGAENEAIASACVKRMAATAKGKPARHDTSARVRKLRGRLDDVQKGRTYWNGEVNALHNIATEAIEMLEGK